jgi:SHAQKYF class myb-like DNA-binding protein
MLPGGRNSSSSDLARSSRPRSSNRNGPKSRRRKNRKQSSSPTSLLLLDSDDESYNDDENDRLEEHCYSTSACHASSSRPSPIPWTNDLHKEFVNAVFQIGIEESSPAVIAEQMITKNSYSLPQHQHQHQPASSSSPVLLNIGHDPLSPVAMAAALASIGGDRDKTARGKPPNHHHHQSKPGRSYENNSSNNNNDLLPEEAEYYKRELTGERLKSHLQKMRKQKVREKQVFLEDYQRCLVRKQALDKEHKEVEKLQKERKEEARNRRRLKLKRKRSQEKPPSTLLDTWQHDSGSDENGIHEDVSKEEEERLLSMYLPLRSSVAIRQNDDNLDLGYDSNHELIFDESINSRNHSYCAFPVGGKAIGMVTFAVQQQEIEDRTKREQKQKQRKVQHQQQQQRQQQQQQQQPHQQQH